MVSYAPMIRIRQAPPLVAPAAPRVAPAVKTTDPFYLSPPWRALVSAIRRQRGLRCEACGRDCRSDPRSLIADHVVERRDGGADLDPLNIRLLCTPCHNRKTAAARMGRGA